MYILRVFKILYYSEFVFNLLVLVICYSHLASRLATVVPKVKQGQETDQLPREVDVAAD